MRMNSRILFAILTAAFATLSSSGAQVQAALLEGKHMAALLLHKTTAESAETGPSSGIFLVGPGVELPGFGYQEIPVPLPALIDVDVSDTAILITLLIDQPFAYLERFEVGDALNEIDSIKSVTVDPSTNWAGFDPARIGGSSQNVIFVNLGQLSGLTGQFVLLNVTPEPTAAVLALPALPVVALRRRGRRET